VTGPQRRARDDAQLVALLGEVRRCREAVQQGRRLSAPATHQTGGAQAGLCAALATAMEAYADAAAASGVPLPYRYRDEMRLYRAMAHGTADPR
jgi:hypothetical protein